MTGVVLTLLAGCDIGEDAEEPTTVSRGGRSAEATIFRDGADAVCQEAALLPAKHPFRATTTGPAIADLADTLLARADYTITGLRALDPPQDQLTAYRSWLSALTTARGHLRAARTAGRGRNFPLADRELRSYTNASNRAQFLAEAFDAEACAESE
ncbi:MAG: hypothetical protein H0T39_08320 [Actinobacteria bacterium]|nr:hypothetical protein [Actinomycetota bacterium]